MKSTALFGFFTFVISTICAQNISFIQIREVADSSQKIYVSTYSSEGNLTNIDSCFATKFVFPSKEDTIREVYARLHRKPFIIWYLGSKYRMLSLQKDNRTVGFWGIDTIDFKGIYFPATINKSDDETYITPPMVEWETFSWKEPDAIGFLQFLLKYEFGKQTLIFNILGGNVDLEIMVPTYESLRSP